MKRSILVLALLALVAAFAATTVSVAAPDASGVSAPASTAFSASGSSSRIACWQCPINYQFCLSQGADPWFICYWLYQDCLAQCDGGGGGGDCDTNPDRCEEPE